MHLLDFILGLLGGFAANVVVSMAFAVAQFRFSMAGYRVQRVAEATREICGSSNRARICNKHRYSLGIIIDRLEQTFGRNGSFKSSEWPCLVHYARGTQGGMPQIADRDGTANPKADRWDLFNLYVRPVIEDIDSFSYIGRYLCFSKIFRQLKALTKLCTCLENVVCEFDAAFGAGLVKLVMVNSRVVIRPTSPGDVAQLEEEYCKLYRAWRKWLCVMGGVHTSGWKSH